ANFPSWQGLWIQPDGRLLILIDSGSLQLPSYTPIRLTSKGGFEKIFQTEQGIRRLALEDNESFITVRLPVTHRPEATFILERMRNDGSKDTNFFVQLAGPQADIDIPLVVQQADKKLLVRGGFTLVNGVPCTGLIRLNADGTLDQSFSVSADIL